jgi:hypothetical protein
MRRDKVFEPSSFIFKLAPVPQIDFPVLSVLFSHISKQDQFKAGFESVGGYFIFNRKEILEQAFSTVAGRRK